MRAATHLIGATEAALAAVTGIVTGFGGSALARPFAARWGVDGAPFFPQDLRLSWVSALLVGAGVPALAVVAALLALRRVQISPLGVGRHAPPGTPTWRRLTLLTVGLVGLAVALPTVAASSGLGLVWLLAAAITMVIVGIIVAGPWLTMGVGRLLIRLARRPATLLAGHRLATDPTTGFRSIAGLVVVVFLVTMTAMATATAEAPLAGRDQDAIPAGVVGVEFLYRGTQPLPANQATELTRDLRAVPGVRAVTDVTHASHVPWRPPPATYWWTLAGGTAAALAIAVLTTIPLLGRLTAPETTRFE